jgi:Kelch motif
VFRDLHALDPLTFTWYQGPEGGGAPAARFDHTANLVGGTKMVLFGGWNGHDFYNDVHVLDLQIMAWSKPDTSGKFDSIKIIRTCTISSQRPLRNFDWQQPGNPRWLLV